MNERRQTGAAGRSGAKRAGFACRCRRILGQKYGFCDDFGEARDVLEIPDEAERALAGGGDFCLQKVWEIPEKRVTKFGNCTLLFGAGVLK